MATPDLTVMGAGVIGLSVAYACVRRGAKVRVIDKHGIAAGASGGIVGALAPHTPDMWIAKKQFQLESLLMAQDFWDGVSDLSGLATGYARTGRLQTLDTDRAIALARERETDAKHQWGDAATWNVIAADGFALMPRCETGLLVHDTLAGRIHPKLATESLTQAFVALGGEICIGTAEPVGSVVWATGYQGLLRPNPDNDLSFGNGVKGQALAIKWDTPDHPQVFTNGIHFVPHSNGTLAIGSTSEREFDDPQSTDDQLDQLWDRARELVPAVRDAEIVSRWAGVRPRAKTRAPILGALPERPGNFIANGGFKIGFGMAPKMGSVMADLVLEGIDNIPEGFRVEDCL